jgi:chemotaxis protein methyltransferase CheR
MKNAPHTIGSRIAGDEVPVRSLPLQPGEISITDGEFRRFRELVQRHTGISLAPHKQEMLKARLSRRLRALGLKSFSSYYQHLCERDPKGEELRRMINAVTTNVTEFFREKNHFQFLSKIWLPELQADAGRKRIRFWSAGCSTGEEPYTIALVLREALGPELTNWDIRILASDIDTDALDRATSGVYPLNKVAAVPKEIVRRNFLRGTGSHEGLVQVHPQIQALITFRCLNLLDDPWPIRTRFDAIFCRNVMIYFDRPTQQLLVKRMSTILQEDGLLFLGHSEGLNGMTAGLTHRQNTIYQRTTADRITHNPLST